MLISACVMSMLDFDICSQTCFTVPDLISVHQVVFYLNLGASGLDPTEIFAAGSVHRDNSLCLLVFSSFTFLSRDSPYSYGVFLKTWHGVSRSGNGAI